MFGAWSPTSHGDGRRAAVLATVTVFGVLVAGTGPIRAVAGGDAGVVTYVR